MFSKCKIKQALVKNCLLFSGSVFLTKNAIKDTLVGKVKNRDKTLENWFRWLTLRRNKGTLTCLSMRVTAQCGDELTHYLVVVG